MKTKILDRVKNIKEELSAGERIFFVDNTGKAQIGSVRIKKVRCGKVNCRSCPHKIYAYARYREGKTVKEKYIGVAR